MFRIVCEATKYHEQPERILGPFSELRISGHHLEGKRAGKDYFENVGTLGKESWDVGSDDEPVTEYRDLVIQWVAPGGSGKTPEELC